MPFEILLLPAGAFLAALVVGAAGFGDALIAAAVWLHVLGPREAVPLIVSTGLLIHGVALVRLRGHLVYSRLIPFLAGGVFGVPVGNWLLGIVDAQAFRAGVGVFLVIYAAAFLVRPPVAHITAGGRAADAAVGWIGGVLGGLAGLAGIVPSVWAGLRGWPKAEQRGLFQPFVVALNGMALAWLAWDGLVDWAMGKNLLICLPAVALGAWLGLRVYGRLDERRFRRIVLVTLLVLGLTLLIFQGQGTDP